MGVPRVNCKGHDAPFRMHRPYRGSGDQSNAKIRRELQTLSAGQGLQSCNDYTWLQLQRLRRASVIEGGGGLVFIRRIIMMYLSRTVAAARSLKFHEVMTA